MSIQGGSPSVAPGTGDGAAAADDGRRTESGTEVTAGLTFRRGRQRGAAQTRDTATLLACRDTTVDQVRVLKAASVSRELG